MAGRRVEPAVAAVSLPLDLALEAIQAFFFNGTAEIDREEAQSPRRPPSLLASQLIHERDKVVHHSPQDTECHRKLKEIRQNVEMSAGRRRKSVKKILSIFVVRRINV